MSDPAIYFLLTLAGYFAGMWVVYKQISKLQRNKAFAPRDKTNRAKNKNAGRV